MRFIKRIFCRCFQEVFHLVIPVLPYKTPEVLRGIDRVPELLEKKQIRRVLLGYR